MNLRGYGAGSAMRPVEVLVAFLLALGVRPGDIPTDLEPAAALYRSLLTAKRMLVLLDNARDADQVRPLLPAGPGCVVLITSRERLLGMVATDGAVRVELEPLTPTESGANLTAHPRASIGDYATRLAGEDRLAHLEIDRDPHASVRVAFDHSYAGLPADARCMFRGAIGPSTRSARSWSFWTTPTPPLRCGR